jgi:hypothetical protein
MLLFVFCMTRTVTAVIHYMECSKYRLGSSSRCREHPNLTLPALCTPCAIYHRYATLASRTRQAMECRSLLMQQRQRACPRFRQSKMSTIFCSVALLKQILRRPAGVCCIPLCS